MSKLYSSSSTISSSSEHISPMRKRNAPEQLPNESKKYQPYEPTQNEVIERYEKFSTCFVNEFEMYIEVQRIIIEDKTSKNDRLKGIAMDSINEIFNSVQGFVGKTVTGVKDYILEERKLDIAGKIVKLINKYDNPEEKKAIRAMLVRVAYELFRSYEHQFMMAEKSHGGWSEAMVQLARTAVWCFMHYYKFKPKDELNEKYLLEGITLKNMPGVGFWKKWYYKDAKKFKKVTNKEDQVKFDGVKLFSKVGIVLDENQQLSCYKNDSMKPEKYGFRRIFSHETNESIKNEYTDEVDWHQNYEYILDMKTATKKTMCEKMLKQINSNDDSLLEDRLMKNMERIIQNIVENLMCEMMEQLVATINGISVPATISTTTNINNVEKKGTVINPTIAGDFNMSF